MDRTRRHGLAVTTPGRTIADVASLLDGENLERVVAEALVQKLVSELELTQRALTSPALRSVLRRGPAFTRSEAERLLLLLIRQARLPIPRFNVVVEGKRVDAVWDAQRLVLETDGFQFHGTRPAFERDRRRDLALNAAGWRVVRLSWRQLTQEPHAVIAALAAALAHARAA